MLDRLSEALTNAGIPMERVEGVPGAPVLVFQAVASSVQRMEAQTIADSFDWSPATHATWLANKMRAMDALLLEGLAAGEVRAMRALILVMIEELNAIRTWTRDFKTQTAAATNLANFQSRVASLPTLGDRTATQARTAIRDKINAGDADT